MLKNVIKKNSYYDSATLMLLTSKVAPSVGGSKNVAVMMATEMNKELMRGSGLLSDEGEAASPNDLIFAVRAEDEAAADAAIAMAQDILEKKNSAKAAAGDTERVYKTTEEALEGMGGADVAVVSLPGAFAHIEVKRLLKNDVNVLLFSDNVSLEHEIALKDLAIERGLLMMGPDCGTAVVNGVGLGFSNKVKRGPVGIVAASGTGMQEVMTLVSNFGSGVSQALGTGGRDVKDAVGGRMMLHCLDMLEADPNTKVIAIIAKPPAPSVVAKLNERIKTLTKPVVACLLGDTSNLLGDSGCVQAHTLTQAAARCLELAGVDATIPAREDADKVVADLKAQLAPSQRYMRGLYCGGTLSYETQLVLRDRVGEVWSNAPLDHDFKLADSAVSQKNTVLDLGDDEFTVGKPHPMIQPSLRHDRLIAEALDPEVAVIALDIEIGYGSNDEAGQILADEVTEARELLAKEGRTVGFFATICGSYEDYQGYETQKAILEGAGIVVFETNEQCAQACVDVIA